jgi:hypothetical protein
MRNHQPKLRQAKNISPPPGPEASYDELIAYHSRYTLDELERAGYAEEVPAAEVRDLQASATYQLLLERGLQLKLSRKDCKSLAQAAAREALDVEDLVKRWIQQRFRGATGAMKDKKR